MTMLNPPPPQGPAAALNAVPSSPPGPFNPQHAGRPHRQAGVLVSVPPHLTPSPRCSPMKTCTTNLYLGQFSSARTHTRHMAQHTQARAQEPGVAHPANVHAVQGPRAPPRPLPRRVASTSPPPPRWTFLALAFELPLDVVRYLAGPRRCVVRMVRRPRQPRLEHGGYDLLGTRRLEPGVGGEGCASCSNPHEVLPTAAGLEGPACTGPPSQGPKLRRKRPRAACSIAPTAHSPASLLHKRGLDGVLRRVRHGSLPSSAARPPTSGVGPAQGLLPLLSGLDGEAGSSAWLCVVWVWLALMLVWLLLS